MKWLGLVLGALIGLSFRRGEPIFVLGVIGFVVGLIVDLRLAASSKNALDARLEKLEESLAQVSKRLAAMESGAAHAPAAEITPKPVTPTPTVMQPVVAPEPVTPIQHVASPSPVAPPPPVTPPPNTRPNPILAFLTGGNTIARVGLLILFFGLAFLLKYAVEHSMVPPEVRVGGVALVGLAMLVGGWKLRPRRAAFALGLQGSGVAVMYLTTFAALRLYHLIDPKAAFVLLAAIAVLSAFLAVAQDALVLAVFGTGGGFLAPILASTGEGSHVALFSYYLLLNLGIAMVALRKSWRSLNIMGFAFTFFIGVAWGWKFYQPDFLATTEPFLIAFFLLYVAIAVLHARRDAPDIRRAVDGTIVFGVPLGAFGLQAALMREVEMGLAFSCIAASALYLGLTAVLKRSKRERFADLAECFLALGVVFATLAIPYALDARWTSALWALEGAAILWIGLRQGRRIAAAFAVMLQLGAGVALFDGSALLTRGFPWIDAGFLGALIVAVAGLVSSRLLSRGSKVSFAPPLAAPAFVWGIAWWLIAARHDIEWFLASEYRSAAYVVVLAATAVVFSILARRMDWAHARWPALALVPALVLAFLLTMAHHDHPFAHVGWAAWPYAFVAVAWLLHRHEGDAEPTYRRGLHVASALLLAAVAALELHWLAATYAAPHTAWTIAAYAVGPCVVLLAIADRRGDRRWPIRGNERAYRVGAGLILSVLLVMWTFVANVTHDGRSDPLPYMPLVNALDLAHILAILAIASLVLAWRRTSVTPPNDVMRAAVVPASVAAFVWLNAMLLRSIHHYAGVPYILGPMMESVLVQAALSIFWTVLALALMLFATRGARRATWLTGAALMAVVVVKLFVLDLSHVTGIERIVSFIAVGVLMLLVGYFAPVPPRAAGAAA